MFCVAWNDLCQILVQPNTASLKTNSNHEKHINHYPHCTARFEHYSM